MSKVTILQIGRDNWMNQLELPQNITWIYLRAGLASDIKARMKQGKIKSFDAVLVNDPLALWLLSDLRDYLAPYTVFYDETIKIVDPRVKQFTKEVYQLISLILRNSFGSYQRRYFQVSMVINCFLSKFRYNHDLKGR